MESPADHGWAEAAYSHDHSIREKNPLKNKESAAPSEITPNPQNASDLHVLEFPTPPRSPIRSRTLSPFSDDSLRDGIKSSVSLSNRRYGLDRHKPYDCDWPDCNKSLTSLSKLRSHLRTHGYVRYCHFCNWAFSREENFRNHLYERHITLFTSGDEGHLSIKTNVPSPDKVPFLDYGTSLDSKSSSLPPFPVQPFTPDATDHELVRDESLSGKEVELETISTPFIVWTESSPIDTLRQNAQPKSHSSQESTMASQSKSQLGQRMPLVYYDCAFSFLGCKYVGSDETQWKEHSLSHFLQHPPPRSVACPFCDWKFEDSDHQRAWDIRMIHVATHQKTGKRLTLPDRLDAPWIDSNLLRHLWEIDIISDYEYAGLSFGIPFGRRTSTTKARAKEKREWLVAFEPYCITEARSTHSAGASEVDPQDPPVRFGASPPVEPLKEGPEEKKRHSKPFQTRTTTAIKQEPRREGRPSRAKFEAKKPHRGNLCTAARAELDMDRHRRRRLCDDKEAEFMCLPEHKSQYYPTTSHVWALEQDNLDTGASRSPASWKGSRPFSRQETLPEKAEERKPQNAITPCISPEGDDHIGTEVPPDLKDLLRIGDLRGSADFLERFPYKSTASQYLWIKELLDMDYSTQEVVELLQELSVDSPWIYFEPSQVSDEDVKEDFHSPGCPHAKTPHQYDSTVSKESTRSEQHDIKNLVEGLCGLGGVAPLSRDRSKWTGTVHFDHDLARVSYSTEVEWTQSNLDSGLKESFRRLAKSLDNIHRAAAVLQGHGLCCDGFSILVRPFETNHYKRNGNTKSCELVRIPFSWITKFRVALFRDLSWDSLSENLTVLDSPLPSQKTTSSAENIMCRAFEAIGHVSREFFSELKAWPDHWMDMESTSSYFSDACLAVQILATGLSSYLQAHVSPLMPFFLDRDIRGVVLTGSGLPGKSIALRPLRMTCMDEMLQSEVLVFQHASTEASEERYNLLATPEDLLDTWGPGCYIKLLRRTEHDPDVCGVRIGGGTIMRAPEQTNLYHFFPTTVSLPETSWQPIQQDQRIMIGAPIEVNGSCNNDESMRYRQCDPFLVSLGTHPYVWEATQRQVALQGGQYLVPQFAQTWNKTPSATIKKCQLSQHSPLTTSFLESHWGLQVSFCTGIARRVRMRELLADLVGVHIHNQLRVPLEWSQLEEENVIEALRTEPDLQVWLGKRSEEQQECLEKVIRQILERLGPTGIDCTGNLTIAWMRPNREPRCLRIPCERESSWAKILADSVDCATYAYFTSKCLETDKIQCQGPDAIWHRRSSLLATAVSPHQDFAGTATVQTTFQLEDRRFYYLSDSNLVRAQALGPNEMRLLFQRTSIAPQVFRRMRQKARCYRIRERQENDSPARPVLVLTAER
ncbi:hypothetical protein IWZ00DRAFT_169301 [Phyllosticta capitalensis]